MNISEGVRLDSMSQSMLNSKLRTADLCRANGWGPGTRLVGDEGYGPSIIEITAVGEIMMLAKCISHNGGPGWVEGSWTLRNREWQEVTLQGQCESGEGYNAEYPDELTGECPVDLEGHPYRG